MSRKLYFAIIMFIGLFAVQTALASTAGLIHNWTFNDATGRSINDSVGGQNGVLTGSSTGLGWASGKGETGLGMDGVTGASVVLPDGAIARSNQGSLSLWFDLNDMSEGNILFSGKSPHYNSVYVALYIDYEGRPEFQFRTTDTGVDRKAQGGKALNKNEWYNLVLTADSQTYRMYINGEEVVVYGDNIGRWVSDLVSETLSYRIGSLNSTPKSGVLNGYIDEFRVYDHALSLNEAIEIYNEVNIMTPMPPLLLRPAISFFASSEMISQNDSVTLNWSTVNITSCTASGDWDGSVENSGTLVISDIAHDSEFTINCVGPDGSFERTVQVRVESESITGDVTESDSAPTDDASGDVSTETAQQDAISADKFERDMTIGETGDSVHRLQLLLIQAGFLENQYATGYFGSLTKAAVMKFQESRGVPSTGYFGPMTRAAVNSYLKGSLVVSAVPVPPPFSTDTTESMNVSAMSKSERDAKIAEIMKLIIELQAELAQMQSGN